MEEYASWEVKAMVPEGRSDRAYADLDDGPDNRMDAILKRHLHAAKAEMDEILQRAGCGFQVELELKSL